MYKIVFRFYEEYSEDCFEYVGKKTVENVKKEEIESQKQEILKEFECYHVEVNIYDENDKLVPFGEV